MWVGRGTWAIADQGLFATSNFVLNVLLARWLMPSEYGAFSIAYTTFILIGSLHAALLVEPMLVYGAGAYRQQFLSYLKELLRGHWIVVIAAAACFSIAGAAFSTTENDALASALFGLSFASPAILFQWLLRKAAYVRQQPQLAAAAGGMYMALMLAGAYSLFAFDHLGLYSAFGLLATSSTFSGAWLLHMIMSDRRIEGTVSRSDVVQKHWSYGRWSFGASILAYIPANLYFFVLPIQGGLEATATLRALMNLIMPILQANSALSLVLLPALVHAREEARLRRVALVGLTGLVGASVGYWLVAATYAEPLLTLLYGDVYADEANALWLLGMYPVLAAAMAVLGTTLRALERPKMVFAANACSTAVACTIGLSATLGWGVPGAALGLVATSATTAAVEGVLLRYKTPRSAWRSQP